MTDLVAVILAVAEHIDGIRCCRILMHLTQDGAQRLDHRIQAIKMQGTHFVPGIPVNQIHRPHQTLLTGTETEHILAMFQYRWHLFRPVGGRITFQIEENSQMADFTRPAQRQIAGRRQFNREGVRQILTELMQEGSGNIRTGLPDVHHRIRYHQAIKVSPRHQLGEIAVIFQRCPSDDVMRSERVFIQIPALTIDMSRWYLNQAQMRFAQIRCNLQVDALHLARQRFKRGIEFTRQNADIFRVDGFTDVIASCKLDQLAVALHQRTQQLLVGNLDLFDLPLIMVIEMLQGGPIPAPVPHQFYQQITPPAAMLRRKVAA